MHKEGEESPAILERIHRRHNTLLLQQTNRRILWNEYSNFPCRHSFTIVYHFLCLFLPYTRSIKLGHHFSLQVSNILLFSDSITSYSLLSLHNFSTSLLSQNFVASLFLSLRLRPSLIHSVLIFLLPLPLLPHTPTQYLSKGTYLLLRGKQIKIQGKSIRRQMGRRGGRTVVVWGGGVKPHLEEKGGYGKKRRKEREMKETENRRRLLPGKFSAHP